MKLCNKCKTMPIVETVQYEANDMFIASVECPMCYKTIMALSSSRTQATTLAIEKWNIAPDEFNINAAVVVIVLCACVWGGLILCLL